MKIISRYVFFLIISLIAVLPWSNLSYSSENDPPIYAFYCPAEEIAFIGELMFPSVSIMEDDKIKDELGISNAQIEKIREIDHRFITGIKDILTRNGNRDGSAEKHVIAIGKLSEEARSQASEILKQHQMRRMKELLLQLKGIFFIPKKDLKPLLKLDRKQEREIDEIRSEIFKRIDETALPNTVVSFSGKCKFATIKSKDIAALLEENEKSVYRLLSSEQRENIDKLSGKSFSFRERADR